MSLQGSRVSKSGFRTVNRAASSHCLRILGLLSRTQTLAVLSRYRKAGVMLPSTPAYDPSVTRITYTLATRCAFVGGDMLDG
jgi:hypothetical protein